MGWPTNGDDDLVTAGQDLLGANVVPLSGGYSGETFLLRSDDEDVVLRVYGRQPGRAAVDAALLQLVRPFLPVPRVLDLRVGGDGASHLVTERLPGVRLDVALPMLSRETKERAGREIGEVLARLSGMPFVRRGEFVDESLAVEPWPQSTAENVRWLEQHLDTPWFSVQPERVRGALELLADSADELWEGRQRACLVHSDCNPKNLLVDASTGALTGVLDWEFAHAGLPYADVGNLTRFHPDEVLEDAAATAYEANAPALDADWRELAQAADLVALVDLAARDRQNPVVAAARRLLVQRALTSADAAGA